MTTHNLIIDFGKHKGERWTRVPVQYLTWLVNNGRETPITQLAREELERRGTTMPTDLILSGHAIDRASQITKEWHTVGVYSWLTKIANKALKSSPEKEEVIYFNGFKFCFIYGEYYPTLKSVMYP